MPKPRGTAATTTSAPKTTVTATTTATATATKKTTAMTASKSATMKENRMTPRTNMTVKPSSPGLKKKPVASSSTSAATTAEINALKASNEEANRALSELKLEMDGLEKERDFYFEKLRDVEILLQDLEDKGEGTPLCAKIFEILYATAEGFEQVEEAPAVVATVPPAPDSQEEDSAVVLPPAVPEDDVEPSPATFNAMSVEQETY